MKCPSCDRAYGRDEFDRDEVYFECEDCGVELTLTSQEMAELVLRRRSAPASAHTPSSGHSTLQAPDLSSEIPTTRSTGSTGVAMSPQSSSDIESLRRDTANLKTSSLIQVSMLATGIVAFVSRVGSTGSSGLASWVVPIGFLLFFASFLAYVPAVAFAYLVQDKLYKLGLYPRGGWHVVVAALVLNPFVAGFWPPLSVYFAAKQILARYPTEPSAERLA